jgi:hypothetical protein
VAFPQMKNDSQIQQEAWYVTQAAAKAVEDFASERTNAVLQTTEFVNYSLLTADTTATVFRNLLTDINQRVMGLEKGSNGSSATPFLCESSETKTLTNASLNKFA